MKTAKLLTFLLGAALSCMAELAFAQAATVSTVSGTVQAIPNAGVPRTLRMGDSVNQGDTIFTGADSSAVRSNPKGNSGSQKDDPIKSLGRAKKLPRRLFFFVKQILSLVNVFASMVGDIFFNEVNCGFSKT